MTAANWAKTLLESWGFAVTTQSIDVATGTSCNVIAERSGTDAGERNVVVLMAHLDSVNHQGGPDAAAPGADDNGSGSAGLLCMAKLFAGHATKHDLRFILFGGEEQGLLGSPKYVDELSADERERILAVINMDMIGSLNAQPAAVLLEGAAVSQSVIDVVAEAAETYTDLVVQTSLNPYASDHVPFIQATLPAILSIEGADSANGNIHSANDTLATVNGDFAMRILRMNMAAIARLAELQATTPRTTS